MGDLPVIALYALAGDRLALIASGERPVSILTMIFMGAGGLALLLLALRRKSAKDHNGDSRSSMAYDSTVGRPPERHGNQRSDT
jgi:hypothetical protein